MPKAVAETITVPAFDELALEDQIIRHLRVAEGIVHCSAMTAEDHEPEIAKALHHAFKVLDEIRHTLKPWNAWRRKRDEVLERQRKALAAEARRNEPPIASPKDIAIVRKIFGITPKEVRGAAHKPRPSGRERKRGA